MHISVKRQNHRVHPCSDERKPELLRHLIDTRQGRSVLVVTSEGSDVGLDAASLADVRVCDDTELSSHPELRCDLLVSYDLPEKALLYIHRLMRADSHALALVNPQDQKKLYPIEVLLGRTILQEIVPGFEPTPPKSAKEEIKAEHPKRSKERKPSREKSSGKGEKRPHRKEEKPSSSPSTKEGGKSVYLGKDENGKPIFSGKTRERNHYIDGTPRTEAEKAAKSRHSSKPKFYGDDKGKPGSDKPSGEKKENRYGDKKPKNSGKDKPAFDKPRGKKPNSDKKGSGATDQKPKAKASAPARPPKRITVKSLTPAPSGSTAETSDKA